MVQQHHSAAATTQAHAEQPYQSVIDKGGLMEHLAPILLLALIILAARWLSRRPRREAAGR